MKLDEIVPGEKYWYKGVKYIALRSWGDCKIWPVEEHGDSIAVDKDIAGKMLPVSSQGGLSADMFGRPVVNGKEITFTDVMMEIGIWVEQITRYCRQAECHPRDLIEAHKNKTK